MSSRLRHRTTGEVWRTVPSLPIYEASSLGRVRHKPYPQKTRSGTYYIRVPKAFYGDWDKSTKRYRIGYHGKYYKVARMVCEAFHGRQPEGKPKVLHLDESPSNNRPDNLKWGTQKENLNAPGYLIKLGIRMSALHKQHHTKRARIAGRFV